MATGILSVGCQLGGWTPVAQSLLVLTGVEYALLVVLTVRRFVTHRRELTADAHDARKAFLFFTFVAGTDVFATGNRTSADVITRWC
ncbi:hypothetical protein HTV45_23265 [Streptomyces sp. CHD11]|nr:hypothetical protein [Streptomyces sp. CHD11]